MNKNKIATLSTLLLTFSFATIQAATISEIAITQYTNATGTKVNISDYGSLDWAYWNSSESPFPNNGAPTNQKAKSGASLISSVSVVGGNNEPVVRGAGSVTNVGFDYSGGTSPTSGTIPSSGRGVTGILNSNLGVSGSGVSMTVTLPSTDYYYFSLWTAAYRTDGNTRLTISLAGATDYVSEGTTYSAGGNTSYAQAQLYEFAVQADNPDDTLTVNLVTTAGGGSTHVRIAGAAIVPEPSTYAAIFGVSMLLFVAYRRLRR